MNSPWPIKMHLSFLIYFLVCFDCTKFPPNFDVLAVIYNTSLKQVKIASSVIFLKVIVVLIDFRNF